MTSIEKHLVPYELKLKLENLGCKDFINHLTHDPYPTENKGLLFEQAFNWFRDRKGLMSYIKFKMGYGWDAHSYHIFDTFAEMGEMSHVGEMCSYEEARIACLDKLIELCQKK